MNWKVGDWVIYERRIGQIKEFRDDFVEFSDGSFCTSGRLTSDFRPLTLRNKRAAEFFEHYYNELRNLNGEAGFNYPDINRHFAQLALDAIDGDEKVPFEKAQEFVRDARDYKQVIQGVALFRPNLRAAR